MPIEISNTLKRAIYSTWGQIAYDVGEVESNEVAIELCVDADRLKTFGNAEADAELKALFEANPIAAVMAALDEEVSLEW